MVTQLCVDRLGKDRHRRLLEGLAESGMGVHGATEVLAARVVPVKNHTERKVGEKCTYRLEIRTRLRPENRLLI